jgi:hypothetical protein
MGYSGFGIGADDFSRVMETARVWQKLSADFAGVYTASRWAYLQKKGYNGADLDFFIRAGEGGERRPLVKLGARIRNVASRKTKASLNVPNSHRPVREVQWEVVYSHQATYRHLVVIDRLNQEAQV